MLDMIMVGLCCMGLVYAAAHDVAARTIPNAVSLAIGAAGAVHGFCHHETWMVLATGAAIFSIGVAAWRLQRFGGGDVKLLAAASLWLAPGAAVPWTLTVSIAGGVLACLYLALGRLLSASPGARPTKLLPRVLRVERRRISQGQSLPYAVAIAAASIGFLVA